MYISTAISYLHVNYTLVEIFSLPNYTAQCVVLTRGSLCKVESGYDLIKFERRTRTGADNIISVYLITLLSH